MISNMHPLTTGIRGRICARKHTDTTSKCCTNKAAFATRHLLLVYEQAVSLGVRKSVIFGCFFSWSQERRSSCFGGSLCSLNTGELRDVLLLIRDCLPGDLPITKTSRWIRKYLVNPPSVSALYVGG